HADRARGHGPTADAPPAADAAAGRGAGRRLRRAGAPGGDDLAAALRLRQHHHLRDDGPGSRPDLPHRVGFRPAGGPPDAALREDGSTGGWLNATAIPRTRSFHLPRPPFPTEPWRMQTAAFFKDMFGLEGQTAVVIGGTGELCG